MDSDFHTGNRNALVEALNGGLIVLRAYASMQSSGDMAAPFLQEANFWYLTGLDAPDWMLIIDGTHKTWLVAPEIDEIHQVFNGSKDYQEALRISGADSVISPDEASKLLRELARKHSVVHTVDQPSYADSFGFVLNPALQRNRQMLERTFATVRSCNTELSKLRASKQPAEIAAIKSAVKQTVASFKLVHSQLSKYRYEYEIEADFTHEFRRAGLVGHAYEPIIAAGHNACTLHYAHNNAKITNRQLVLLDVGARFQGYAADITRTYAKGEPTKRQRAVHEAVERAHHEIVKSIEPGLLVEEYQRKVMRIMEREITELGLMQPGEGQKLRRYFPHAISHGLGIDVHDSLGGPRMLEPSMILTVEPGIYIPEEGIGVRIEDDILVTKTRSENLSASLSTAL